MKGFKLQCDLIRQQASGSEVTREQTKSLFGAANNEAAKRRDTNEYSGTIGSFVLGIRITDGLEGAAGECRTDRREVGTQWERVVSIGQTNRIHVA